MDVDAAEKCKQLQLAVFVLLKKQTIEHDFNRHTTRINIPIVPE